MNFSSKSTFSTNIRGTEPLPSTAISRNSGSLKGRPNRRRRQVPKTSSSTESSSSHASSLRRVKSQSNLNQAQPEIGFPTSPEDVSQWSRRRNSVDTTAHPGVYELDDTSSTAAPSETLTSADQITTLRRKNPFRLVI